MLDLFKGAKKLLCGDRRKNNIFVREAAIPNWQKLDPLKQQHWCADGKNPRTSHIPKIILLPPLILYHRQWIKKTPKKIHRKCTERRSRHISESLFSTAPFWCYYSVVFRFLSSRLSARVLLSLVTMLECAFCGFLFMHAPQSTRYTFICSSYSVIWHMRQQPKKKKNCVEVESGLGLYVYFSVSSLFRPTTIEKPQFEQKYKQHISETSVSVCVCKIELVPKRH